MSAQSTATPLVRVIAAGLRSNTTILFTGEPGEGKTAKLTAMAQSWGRHVEVVVGSNRQPEDFLGLPTEYEGTTSYLDVDWAVRAAAAEQATIIFDELNTGGDVFKAMLRVLAERTVGNLVLPKSVSMIAAANPVDIAVDGVDLAAPIANRVVHLDWHFDIEEWLNNVTTGFADVIYPPMDSLLGPDDDAARLTARSQVVAYLRYSPDRLRPGVPADHTARSGAYPTPRSWTYAMDLLAELKPGDDEAALLAVIGAVGETDAHRFMAWKTAADLYDPMWALDNPDEIDFMGSPDRITALVLAVEGIAMSDETYWSPAVRLMTRCADAGRPDLALVGIRRLLNQIPSGKRVPRATRDAFADIFTNMDLWQAA